MCANEQALAELRGLVKGRRCVAFVGSGVSRGARVDWDGLVRLLCDRCGVDAGPALRDGGIDRSEFLQGLADEALARSPHGYAAVLREQFGAPAARPRRTCGLLARLPFKAYVTTNFDSDLADALRVGSAGGGMPKLYSYPILPVRELRDRAVFHLHGRASPGMSDEDFGARLVLGRNQFAAAYGGGASELASFLRQVLAYEEVLFLGFSLSDPNFRALLGACDAARLLGVAAPLRHALLPCAPRAVGRSGEADGVGQGAEGGPGAPPGVHPVPYDPVDGDHSGLDRILESWCDLPPLAENVGFAEGGFDGPSD